MSGQSPDTTPPVRKHSNWDKDDKHTEKWQYGIQLGSSSYEYKPEKNYDYVRAPTTSNTRFHGGFFGEYKLSEVYGLYLHMTLLYIGKGTKIRYLNYHGDYIDPTTGKKLTKDKIKLDYLESSVGLFIYFWDNLFVLIDLYMSYLLSAKLYQKFEEDASQLLDDKDMRDDIRPVDIGIILGLGYETDFGLRVCLAPEWGLIRVYKNVSALNSGMNFSIGLNLAKWIKLD